MKASELRIGNYVKSSLSESYYHLGIEHFEMMANYTIEELYQPIPLTEEWLIKLGYKDEGYLENHYDIMGHLIWNAGGEMLVCEKNGVVLEHVHQLQNLYFALTGEELKVKP